jgi:hypothetical protein
MSLGICQIQLTTCSCGNNNFARNSDLKLDSEIGVNTGPNFHSINTDLIYNHKCYC